MSNNHMNTYAATELSAYVAKSLTFEAMDALNKKLDQLVNDYQDTPSLKIMSHIDFSKLESFKNWVPEALTNKKLVMPYLVSDLLEGNIYTLSIYDALYKATNNDELIIDYVKILSNPELKKTFNSYGGAEDARAIMTAEHWLKSTEAAEVFTSGNNQNVLCNANAILHISNEHVDC